MSYDPSGQTRFRVRGDRVAVLPSPEPNVFAARCDPNVFVSLCFADPAGRPLRQAAIHEDLQTFLSEHRRALIEVPRDHGKSTQICARALWELGRDPSLRIKIVCATEGIAAERGRFLREAIAANQNVEQVFPALRQTEPWTETRFGVGRPASVIGPSVTAVGVGAGLTGTRADLLICDDIVDVKSLVSRAERERVKAFFRDNLMNLLEPDGRCWCLCTPWHRDDLNAHLKRNRAFAVFHKAIDADFTPIWADRWPRAKLRERWAEIGAASFARGYRLLPLTEDTAPIRAEWIRYWTAPCPETWDESAHSAVPSRPISPIPCEFDRVILAVDPAVSIDPKADASALVVLGARYGSLFLQEPAAQAREAHNEIRCLEAIACRVRLPELIERIETLDRRWNPQVILFEANAAFKGIKDLLARHAGFGPKLKDIAQCRGKALRVEAFSVPVRNGVFRLRGSACDAVDPSQQALFDEMTAFPVAEHDDLLDAAAMGTEYLLNTREPRVW